MITHAKHWVFSVFFISLIGVSILGYLRSPQKVWSGRRWVWKKSVQKSRDASAPRKKAQSWPHRCRSPTYHKGCGGDSYRKSGKNSESPHLLHLLRLGRQMHLLHLLHLLLLSGKKQYIRSILKLCIWTNRHKRRQHLNFHCLVNCHWCPHLLLPANRVCICCICCCFRVIFIASY